MCACGCKKKQIVAPSSGIKTPPPPPEEPKSHPPMRVILKELGTRSATNATNVPKSDIDNLLDKLNSIKT
jgi:hypothetical protein